jgi:predicted ATPase
MLIVEQPELHLHPAAHGALADLMLKSALSEHPSPPATCIVETHSEQFIMRLRRRIAEGLPSETAVLWSLNHQDSVEEDTVSEPLKVIEFDQGGNPGAWPVGVFEEAFQDLTAMRLAARARGL